MTRSMLPWKTLFLTEHGRLVRRQNEGRAMTASLNQKCHEARATPNLASVVKENEEKNRILEKAQTILPTAADAVSFKGDM